MADETDFLDLYRKLRLEPGCSLEDFKQAYRRNVALWHPDRRRGSRADVLAAARLQRLTRQYGAAMDFYKRHGRLPGAPMAARVAEVPMVEEPEAEASQDAVAEETASVPQRRRRARWWLVVLTVGVGVTVWSMWPASQEFEGNAEQDVIAPAHEEEQRVRETLTLGMSEDQVLAIEGEPTHRGEERWEYGPSWIRFEQGAVADWYSSPLRALRVDSPKPRP